MFNEYIESNSIYERGISGSEKMPEESFVLELKNVSFTYPGTEKEVLHNVNMKITSGKTYGLVGLNGSGKTTLVNLILRFYEPTNGEILLNGINIEEYEISSFYNSIACVFQNTTHYSMPIVDYISAGQKAVTERVNEAISKVNLTEWCESLPHGIDTMLTRAFASENDSIEPSGGQWQKLSIARALYKNSPIMILDEPSANLDVDSENEIFNYIAGLAVKKTALLISHRLSNLFDCDCIFLLKEGFIAEEGSHQELMEMNGSYAELFRSQAKYYNVN